jgi:inhibitor of KinA sporulation pathway (predicted exonuclease)
MTQAPLVPPLTTPFAFVVDLEATCGDGILSRDVEIIEFAGILVDSQWHPVSDGIYERLIRPEKHRLLTRFCMELTGIAQNELDWSERFSDAFPEFLRWLNLRCSGESVTLASWGEFDRRQLHRQAAENHLPYPFSSTHFNLRMIAARALGLKRNQKQGLAVVCEMLGLNFEGTQHRALADGANALAVAQELHRMQLELCQATHSLMP